ncbi:MAG: site-specific DNA-methyltransferase [Gammaproteobacteria bacterium]|nr:site-specific DNA-methyltransferase [Gammaproteobacteria bacterium]
MASLAAKEGFGTGTKGVQMFFFDPPFGIKFNSNFQPRTDSRTVKDELKSLPVEPDSVRPFRDTYKNGIHSYLDQIYRIATHARSILLDTGSFIMQIGDENVNRCALILDEVFGPENRVSMVQFQKTSNSSSKLLPNVGDFLLWYAKDIDEVKFNMVYEELSNIDEKVSFLSSYAMVEEEDGSARPLTSAERSNPSLLEDNGVKLFGRTSLFSQGWSFTGRSEPFTWNNRIWPVPVESHWAISHDGLQELGRKNRLVWAPTGVNLRMKRYIDEYPGKQINNFWATQMFANDLHYVVETSERVLERCILMTTDPGDLVMDITCGSGTTAYVAEKWGRRWITCDAASVPIQLARQRLLTGTYDWFLLKNSVEGLRKEAELQRDITNIPEGDDHPVDPSNGFVYERVPRVSAAIVGYNQKVDPIYLVNKPFKKKGVIRVSGPFTVESTSPYKYVSINDDTDTFEHRTSSVNAVVDALKVSGIAIGNDRIKFEDIEPGQPHEFLTHTARVIESDQRSKTAVLAIVSDDQTVPRSLIDRAADEVAQTAADLLVVIAFAFAADTRTERKFSLGRVEVIKAQANRDLMIADLKDKESDRAIVAIGDPDIKVHKETDGRYSVEICGWDTYDPATGNVRRGDKRDVDTWLLDINYNGNSFFANRIHFPNKASDNQVKRLKSAIARSLNQAEWEAVLSCRSTPFPKPTNSQIAVRIITTTGTEMTTIIDVE